MEKNFSQKGHSHYSTGNPNNSRLEYNNTTNSQWYNKPLGKLVGIMGTVAIVGLGSVLSKSKEEKAFSDSEGDNPIVEIFENNEEAEVGKDVVGTKRRHKYGEATVIQHTRPYVEPCDEMSLHEQTVRKARQILRKFQAEVGAPGLVVGVTVNGKQVWMDGKCVFSYFILSNYLKNHRMKEREKNVILFICSKLQQESSFYHCRFVSLAWMIECL